MKSVYSFVMMMMALGLDNLLGFFLLQHLMFSNSVTALPMEDVIEKYSLEFLENASAKKRSKADSSVSRARGASTDKTDSKDAKVSGSNKNDSVESSYTRKE